MLQDMTGEAGPWQDVARAYRQELYIQGEHDEARQGFEPGAVQRVLDAGGKLPMSQLLHCRVRYFSDGVILGTRAFVDEAFCRHRARFSSKRETGARPMQFGEWTGLCTVRRLRLSVIEPPVLIT